MIGQIKAYFRKKGFYSYRRGWDKGTCLFCGSEEKAGVNYSRNSYHCFKCEEWGSLSQVIMDIEEVDFNGLKNILKDLDSLIVEKELKIQRPDIPEVILPDHYISLSRGKGEVSDRAREYVYNKRGINPERARRMGLGYVSEPGSTFFGSVIFPFKMGGAIIYFQGRRYLAMEPKFLNPDQDKIGRGKSKTLYNFDVLSTSRDVDIMESVFNVLTVNHPAIGLNGKAISPWQFTQLISSKVEVFNIMLDDDAWEYAINLAYRIIPYKPVRLIKFPKDKDVNDLGDELVREMRAKAPILKSRVHLNTYRNAIKDNNRRVRILL